jgi:hypothetical protein
MHARTMVVAGLAVAFGAAAEAQQPRTPAPPPTPLPSKVADSSFVRRSQQANEAELLRVVNEIREREAALLRELVSIPKDNDTLRRPILVKLQNLNREAFTVMSLVESQCIASRTNEPEGYMGVNISSSAEATGGTLIVHQSVIESVELGSPADRAGLMSGDRLLSVGGRDTRNQLPALASVLEPGRRIIVKVERQGQEVDLPLVVGVRERATRVVSCGQFDRAMSPLRMGAVARAWVIDTTDAHGNRVVFLAPSSPPAITGPATPLPSRSPTPPGVESSGKGKLLWQSPQALGWAAIADFDGDGHGEIACPTSGGVAILKAAAP